MCSSDLTAKTTTETITAAKTIVVAAKTITFISAATLATSASIETHALKYFLGSSNFKFWVYIERETYTLLRRPLGTTHIFFTVKTR